MNNIRVSVAIATYNGENYLAEQLDSVLKNLSLNDEIIISDDGSSDSTLEIVEKYKSKYKNISLLKGPCKGVAYNFENALNHCRGEYIFLCDQDDIWEYNKVENCLKVLQEYTLVCHNANIFDSKTGEIIGSTFEKKGVNKTIFTSILKNSFIGCCMAFRRDVLSIATPFLSSANFVMHDWIIGVSGLLTGNCCFFNEKLIRYRIHGNNIVGNIKTSFFYKIKKRIQQVKYIALLKRRSKIK